MQITIKTLALLGVLLGVLGCDPSAGELQQAERRLERFIGASNTLALEEAHDALVAYAQDHQGAFRNLISNRYADALDRTQEAEPRQAAKARAAVYALGRAGDSAFLGQLITPNVDATVIYALADAEGIRFYYAFTEGAGIDQIVPPNVVVNILLRSREFETWHNALTQWNHTPQGHEAPPSGHCPCCAIHGDELGRGQLLNTLLEIQSNNIAREDVHNWVDAPALVDTTQQPERRDSWSSQLPTAGGGLVELRHLSRDELAAMFDDVVLWRVVEPPLEVTLGIGWDAQGTPHVFEWESHIWQMN
jgi:hypothetical protein